MEEKRLNKIKDMIGKRQSGLVAVFEDIHDPHNVQAVARTCESLGIQDVYIIFEKEKAFDPKLVGKGSSSNANKWLTYHIFHSTKKCLASLKKDGYQLVATALDTHAESLEEASLTSKKLALIFGNEKNGVSKKALAMVDRTLYFDMKGMTQSMNLSVSAAIFLYEIIRQRKESTEDFLLDEDERQQLLNQLVA